jgi:hypothetical protein
VQREEQVLTKSWFRLTVFSAGWSLALLAAMSQARADQIDGDWCFPGDGRHLTIQGDDIVTPSGTSLTGDYTRHTFHYVVPRGDPGAGDDISMRQLNDQTMVLLRPDGTEETWKRCDFQTS